MLMLMQMVPDRASAVIRDAVNTRQILGANVTADRQASI
jgi:hypothetical protein